MKEKNNIKQAVEVSSLLELYHLTIKQNLKRLGDELQILDVSEPNQFELLQDEEYLDNKIKLLAETLETIFLKTRHTLRKFPLDTVAQERLETLGVNFDIDTGTVVELEKTEKEIN